MDNKSQIRQELIDRGVITPNLSFIKVDKRVCRRCESTFEVNAEKQDDSCSPCRPARQ
jgi:hypothetical protein